jgi:hypothetical protein
MFNIKGQLKEKIVLNSECSFGSLLVTLRKREEKERDGENGQISDDRNDMTRTTFDLFGDRSNRPNCSNYD